MQLLLPLHSPVVSQTAPSRLRTHEGWLAWLTTRLPEQVPFEQVCWVPVSVPVPMQLSA